MPYRENVSELAEALADMLGIYNHGIRFVGLTPAESRAETDWSVDHAEDCACRACWSGQMEQRIREAVANERRESEVHHAE